MTVPRLCAAHLQIFHHVLQIENNRHAYPVIIAGANVAFFLRLALHIDILKGGDASSFQIGIIIFKFKIFFLNLTSGTNAQPRSERFLQLSVFLFVRLIKNILRIVMFYGELQQLPEFIIVRNAAETNRSQIFMHSFSPFCEQCCFPSYRISVLPPM